MNIEIKDPMGLSEPLKKLIEVVSNGVGALSKSYLIKKNADAKAYETRIMAKSIKENQKYLKGIEFDDGKLSLISLDGNDLKKEPSLKDRTQQRTQFKEQKQQQNIESVVQNAVNNLEQEEKVSDEPVDEDWTSRFFNYVEDISNENMQELWGKILEGEVKNPKSYSLRTLDLLRNLSTEEAEVFRKFGSFAIQGKDYAFLLDIDEEFFREKYQLTFNDRLLLEELGILAANDIEHTILQTTNESVEVRCVIGDTIVIQNKLENKPDQKLKVLVFTKIGKELLQLIDISPKMDFIQLLATKLNRENGSIKYVSIEKLPNEQIRHSPLIDVPLTELEKQNKNQEI